MLNLLELWAYLVFCGTKEKLCFVAVGDIHFSRTLVSKFLSFQPTNYQQQRFVMLTNLGWQINILYCNYLCHVLHSKHMLSAIFKVNFISRCHPKASNLRFHDPQYGLDPNFGYHSFKEMLHRLLLHWDAADLRFTVIVYSCFFRWGFSMTPHQVLHLLCIG